VWAEVAVGPIVAVERRQQRSLSAAESIEKI